VYSWEDVSRGVWEASVHRRIDAGAWPSRSDLTRMPGRRSGKTRIALPLALQQVDGLREVGGADVFGQRRVLALEG
jgi:hypothetical protein